jgi:ribosomal protein S18 acetylase RimI-like enzyme
VIHRRRIRADEAQALRAIRLRALADSPAAFGSSLERERGFDDALWSARASESSAGTRAATFVAEDDEAADVEWLGLVTVLGIGHEAVGGREAAELVSMWIAPVARGQGLGARLVQAAVDFAIACQAPAIELSVTRGNDAALGLYQAHGFVLCADTGLPEDHACRDELRLRRVL